MSGAAWGLVGGIVGGALGLAGGIIGTWFSIHNTKTAEERRFVIRCTAAVWTIGLAVAVLLVLGLAHVISIVFYWVAFMVLVIGMGPAIALGNRRQARLREKGESLTPPGSD